MNERRIPVAVFFLVLVALAVAPAALGQARIDSVIISDSRETMAEKTVYGPQAPKVYAFCMVADATKGTRIRASWVVEKAEGVEANSKMTESTYASPGGSAWIPFSCSKPTKGWPVGTYRVELFLNDKLEKTETFKVTKTGS